MSPMPEKDKTLESTATTTPAENLQRDERIQSRAYERYLERGQEAGHDLDDWLQAEREVDEGSI